MHNAANTQTKKQPPTPQIQHPKEPMKPDQSRGSAMRVAITRQNDWRLVPQPGSSLFLLLLPAFVLELLQLFLAESLCTSLGS